MRTAEKNSGSDAIIERMAHAIARAAEDGCFDRIASGDFDDDTSTGDHEDASYYRDLARAAYASLLDGGRVNDSWIVVHDAAPEPVRFTYSSEAEARAAFERGSFYDPANGWGVTLIRELRGSVVIETTIPKGGES